MTPRTLPGPWQVRFRQEAAADLQRVFDSDPKLYDLVVRGLNMLKAERDPLKPRNPLLNTCRTYPTARGCFRLKVYGECWRVVLRIMETRNGYTYHVLPDESLHDDADAQYLQVIMVDTRDGKTYEVRLARRWEAIVGC